MAASDSVPPGPKASEEHCAAAFAAIEAYLSGREHPALPAGWERTSCPMFVTLNKRDTDGGWSLRGCIGCLSPVALSQLGRYACKAAFHDTRFQPLAREELPSLQAGVSLLIEYEGPLRWDEFEVGVHGIIIEFTSEGVTYSATYLPEVASEQGWDQLTTVTSLARKAGFRGRCTKELLAGLCLTRYKSSKTTMTYLEYRDRSGRS